MKTNPERALALSAGLVIVALTGAAFWLSYAHLAEVALGHGLGGAPVRAWAWPMTLDLFIVAGELMMLRAALLRRVDLWAIGLTVAGSGGSIALNVAGVGSHADPLNYVVAAVPPTAALLAFGALMRQVHQALAGHAEPAADSTAVEVTVERADDEQVYSETAPAEVTTPELARPVPEAVPAGVRLLPIVAREVVTKPADPTFRFDHGRQRWVPVEPATDDQPQALPEPPKVVIPEAVRPPWKDTATAAHDPFDIHPWAKSAVPAEAARQVVTEVITLTPGELLKRAAKLNRDLLRTTTRPVTIDRLRDEFNLSRRDATELRRQVVTPKGDDRS